MNKKDMKKIETKSIFMQFETVSQTNFSIFKIFHVFVTVYLAVRYILSVTNTSSYISSVFLKFLAI